ncbi:integral membrane protein [Fusarium pseudocircinatum]|uniref:Integral membrane protein n=1 Tax=Fusarium pseudocircinatum TaxID=56676 RepID=A0A8H5L6D3_9HYPO|nr:integral membrane protein [Fusarium pseudocircinatum]
MATNETRAPMAMGIIIPLTCLAFIAVTLRVYTRTILVRNTGVDDYFAILSFIMIFACAFDMLWGSDSKNSTCAISIIRIPYLDQSPDLTWDNVEAAAWSIAELCCGLLCACLPTLRPLISRIMPNFLVSRQTPRNSEQRREHASGHTYRDIELDNGIETRSAGKGSQRNRDIQGMEAGEQMSIEVGLDDDERRLTGGSASKPQPAETRWLPY